MSIFSSSKSDQEQQLEKQQEHQVHSAAQSQMFGRDGKVRDEYLKEMVEHGIDEATALHLQNMLTKDFVLSNMEKAEVTELKWLTRVMKLAIVAMHPPKGSFVQGEYREFLHDDPTDGLRALDDDQILKIEQVIHAVVSRAARSKEGWQQEEFGKTYSVSEMRKEDEHGGLF